MGLSSLGRGFAGIALIDIGKLDLRMSDRLHGFGQLADLVAVLGIGRGHLQSEQVTERIDGQMDLRSTLSLGAVVAGPRAAGRRRLDRPAVQYGCPTDREHGHRPVEAGSAGRTPWLQNNPPGSSVGSAGRLALTAANHGESTAKANPCGPSSAGY